MMTPAARKRFRALAHSLKPLVATGHSGLTENVILAIEEALEHHELIKIRLGCDQRDDRKSQAGQICQTTGAELVQLIGKIAVVYRESPDKTA
ncbi:MAG: YhbY family RNA-binding protein [Methylococcaceae bacterium]|nr:YhbY family RNA-binding protein [Methylococcaceae bacterium]MCI0666674.1 YhbY family RNA-binding protein [Methylococcaceae bacterium]MCI0733328.1 YhbY family RNA-binding protein [Methylococcaceae bacterium]